MKKIYLFLALFIVAAISFPIEAATWSSYKIMLDPGHGGSDPGASGPSAPHEATLALRCGLALRDRIVNECGGNVVMTRTTDVFVELSTRRSLSVSNDPYIFCSIHLNAFNTTAKGTETYYYWTTGNSSLLANKVQPQLISNFQKVSGFTPTNRGVKTASYAVLKGSSSVPAILTEGLFVDNSTEWSIINDNSKQGFKMWVQGHLYGFYDRLVLLNSSITNPQTTTVADTTKPTISRTTTVKNNAESFYAYAYVTDNVGVTKVEFPTWTVANGQDDLIWHVGTSGSWTVNGQTYNYRYLVKKSEHKNEGGTYSVHVYANDAAGNRTNTSAPDFTFDTTAPSIARVATAQNDASSFYAYAYATDNVGVTSVSFPTWTNANGQDDLIWHAGTSGNWTVNGQTYNWRYLVKKSEHNNEGGTYTVHVYAYDAFGNSTSSGTSFVFDETVPVISRMLLSANDDNSFYAYAYVTDNVKVTRVRFPAWTELNGQDDLPATWPEGTSGSWTVNGQIYNWRYLIQKSDHNNENGPYTVHVYANDAAGNTSSIQSGDCTKFTIGQGSSTTPGGTTLDDNITAMTEVWNYSSTKGNLSSATWFDATTNYTRDVAVNGENLYVLNCKQWGEPVITILNAFTGASKGTLSVEGISDGRAALGAIDMLGGKLIGINAVTAHELIFYKWDSETAAPTKWATTTPGIAMGDHMSVSGDMTNGAIWLVSTPTNAVYKYTVTNGTVNTTPTVITLSKSIGAQNGNATVAVADDGTIWVDGKDVAPMHFKADGTYIEELSASALAATNAKYANAVELIKFGSKTYMTAANYVDASATLSGGAFTLVDLTNGAEAATASIGTYPSAGLGTTRNTQFLNALTHTLTNNNQQLYVWVAVASQGIACYTFDGAKESETPAVTPEINATPTTTSLSAAVGESATATIEVTGSNLKDDITFAISGDNASLFSVSKSTVARTTASGDVIITYAPTAEGNHTATLTIKSTDAKDVIVALSGYAYAKETSGGDDTNVTVDKLEEMWIYSTNKNNVANANPWFDASDDKFSTDFTRDVAVDGDNLYVLNCKQWGTPVISVVNAFTGESKGTTINTDVATVGRAKLGAIDMLGDQLIGVNAITAHTLTFYKMNSSKTALEKWAEATPGIKMGDHMSVTGDMTNGAIWLISTGNPDELVEDASGNVTEEIPEVLPTIYKYTVTNGVINTTPTIIPIDGQIGNQNGNATLAIAEDGTIWVDGKDVTPTHLEADGSYLEELSVDLLGGGASKNANALELITYGGKKYMTAMTYLDESTTLSKGAIALINMDYGSADAAEQVGIYPSDGFGTRRNIQFVNALTHSLTDDNRTLNIWGVVAGQGIAYYRYSSLGTTGVDAIDVDNAVYPVEWYNLQGVRVDGENLVPGIYIRRQGTDVQKIFVR